MNRREAHMIIVTTTCQRRPYRGLVSSGRYPTGWFPAARRCQHPRRCGLYAAGPARGGSASPVRRTRLALCWCSTRRLSGLFVVMPLDTAETPAATDANSPRSATLSSRHITGAFTPRAADYGFSCSRQIGAPTLTLPKFWVSPHRAPHQHAARLCFRLCRFSGHSILMLRGRDVPIVDKIPTTCSPHVIAGATGEACPLCSFPDAENRMNIPASMVHLCEVSKRSQPVRRKAMQSLCYN